MYHIEEQDCDFEQQIRPYRTLVNIVFHAYVASKLMIVCSDKLMIVWSDFNEGMMWASK